jgi:alpha-glucosidase
VLSNHDVVRHVTRYSRSQPKHLVETDWEKSRWPDEAPDLEVGLARARAAVMLILALPGTAYLYQGEELGVPEVEDIPDDRRQDPIWEQSGHQDLGRDGCRVPLPWSGTAPPYGFSADATAEPWLPQPADWAPLTAEAQEQDPGSMLQHYRTALRLRREHLVNAGDVEWLETRPGVLAFRRGRIECWLNSRATSVDLPDGELVLVSAQGAPPGELPPNAAAWVLR